MCSYDVHGKVVPLTKTATSVHMLEPSEPDPFYIKTSAEVTISSQQMFQLLNYGKIIWI